MRLTLLLVEAAAAIVAAGCGSSVQPSCPSSGTRSVPIAQVCQMMAESGQITSAIDSSSATCNKVCGGLGCSFDDSVASEIQAANPGLDADAGVADAGPLHCPSGGNVTVTCANFCTGRRTQGCAPAPATDPRDQAARLVAMAHLEAVSVGAFERLERELRAHGAPASLRREARRARRDEIRHTAMVSRLARRRGGAPVAPRAIPDGPARGLFEVALENAVEGCVRETFGAVAGLVEASTSPDAELRRAMARIAADECRHAELAWTVHAWAMPRLAEDDRERVRAQMRAEIAAIASRDPVGAARVFRPELTGG